MQTQPLPAVNLHTSDNASHDEVSYGAPNRTIFEYLISISHELENMHVCEEQKSEDQNLKSTNQIKN